MKEFIADEPLAGTNYRQLACSSFMEAQGVELVAYFEPNNLYDSNAIIVGFNEDGEFRPLGYVKKEIAKIINDNKCDGLKFFIKGLKKTEKTIFPERYDKELKLTILDCKIVTDIYYTILTSTTPIEGVNPFPEITTATSEIESVIEEAASLEESFIKERDFKKNQEEMSAHKIFKESKKLLKTSMLLFFTMILLLAVSFIPAIIYDLPILLVVVFFAFFGTSCFFFIMSEKILKTLPLAYKLALDEARRQK